MKITSYNTTKDYLINTPLPVETSTYKPVAHEQLMDLTLEGIHKAGFTLEREIYAGAKGGLVATGKFLINNVYDKEMQLQIMWQNSYDKSLKLTFNVGAMVLVCTNGMMGFRNMNSFKRKHTGEIQTIAPERITEYIKQAGDAFHILQTDREAMKQIEVTRSVVAKLIGEMYIEHNFLESTQLNILKRELDKPTHNYGAPGSLWELYQFTTFAIGGIHPSRWMEDHIDAHRFFVNAAGILVPTNDFQEAIVINELPPNFKQLDWTEEVERMNAEMNVPLIDA